MKNKMLLIDVALCHDCNNCLMACKDEHCGAAREGYSAPQPRHGQRWIDILPRERGDHRMIDVSFLPKPCMHCNAPPCVEAGRGAVVRRGDGVVLIDEKRARGMHELPLSCPYGAMYYDEDGENPLKCNLCAHLLDAGESAPRCVSVCPTGALEYIEVDGENVPELFARGYKPYLAEFGTHPNVLYKNLWKFESEFIGVKLTRAGDCAKDIPVRLMSGGETLAEKNTNAFGECRFDGLAPGSYELAFEDVRARAKLTKSALFEFELK